MKSISKKRLFFVGIIGGGAFFLLVSLISFLIKTYLLDSGFKIGYPFNYYWQFQARGSEYLNYGLDKSKLIIDLLICIVVWLMGYYLYATFVSKRTSTD